MVILLIQVPENFVRSDDFLKLILKDKIVEKQIQILTLSYKNNVLLNIFYLVNNLIIRLNIKQI